VRAEVARRDAELAAARASESETRRLQAAQVDLALSASGR
jgi:hypothetical protein